MIDPNLLFCLGGEMQIPPAHSEQQNLGCVNQGIQVSPTDVMVTAVIPREWKITTGPSEWPPTVCKLCQGF